MNGHTQTQKVEAHFLTRGLTLGVKGLHGEKLPLSFTERLYEKVVPADRAKSWLSQFRISRDWERHPIWRYKEDWLSDLSTVKLNFNFKFSAILLLIWPVIGFAHALYVPTCPW